MRILETMMTQRFSSEVHLLVGKLHPPCSDTDLEVYALIGITRLTRNRVPHKQHKMRIHKLRAIS
jgi:hypothetical protein